VVQITSFLEEMNSLEYDQCTLASSVQKMLGNGYVPLAKRKNKINE